MSFACKSWAGVNYIASMSQVEAAEQRLCQGDCLAGTDEWLYNSRCCSLDMAQAGGGICMSVSVASGIRNWSWACMKSTPYREMVCATAKLTRPMVMLFGN